MADNISVSVTADTSDLRAQLALAQGDLRAFPAETKQLVNSIRAGGDAGGLLRGQLEQVVGAAANAKSNVVSLTSALRDHRAAHDEAAAGIKGVTESLEGMVSPITAAVGGFGQLAEILGVAFATEKLVDFAKEMGELGERTLNLSAAVGTTPEMFSQLSVHWTWPAATPKPPRAHWNGWVTIFRPRSARPRARPHKPSVRSA
jgi:hypothetical protein